MNDEPCEGQEERGLGIFSATKRSPRSEITCDATRPHLNLLTRGDPPQVQPTTIGELLNGPRFTLGRQNPLSLVAAVYIK